MLPAHCTEEWLDHVIWGRIRLVHPLKLTPKERGEFLDAKERGWVLERSRRYDNPLDRAYWMYCEIVQRPFLRVRVARKYAVIVYDFIACDKRLSPAGLGALEAIWRTSVVGDEVHRRQLMKRPAKYRPIFARGDCRGDMEYVSANVERLANTIWQTITAPGNWVPYDQAYRCSASHPHSVKERL